MVFTEGTQDKYLDEDGLQYLIEKLKEKIPSGGNVDLMQSITTEFNTTGAAYKYIEKRIAQVKDKIASIPDPDDDYSCFSLMFTREPQYTPSRYGAKIITPKEIDDMF